MSRQTAVESLVLGDSSVIKAVDFLQPLNVCNVHQQSPYMCLLITTQIWIQDFSEYDMAGRWTPVRNRNYELKQCCVLKETWVNSEGCQLCAKHTKYVVSSCFRCPIIFSAKEIFLRGKVDLPNISLKTTSTSSTNNITFWFPWKQRKRSV